MAEQTIPNKIKPGVISSGFLFSSSIISFEFKKKHQKNPYFCTLLKLGFQND